MSDNRYLNELGDALAKAIREPAAKQRRSFNGPMVAVGTFVAVLAVGALAWVARGPADPVTAPTATTAPSEVDSPVALPLSWGRVPHQDTLEGARSLVLSGVDSGPDGYVAVGYEVVRDPLNRAQVAGPSYRGVILSSEDGASWEDTGLGAFQDVLFQDVAIGPNRLALVGIGPGEGVGFWTSIDGVDWELSPIDDSGTLGSSSVSSVISIEDTFVAVGGGLVGIGRDAAKTAVVWRLDEGETWAEVIAPSFANGSMEGVVLRDGVLYVGGVIATQNGISDAAIWTSRDGGVSWTSLLLPRTTVDGFVGISGIESIADRLVAVGFEGGAGAVWWSEDGTEWVRAGQSDGVFASERTTTRIYDVIATDAGVVATGMESRASERRRLTWMSDDGFVWERLEFEEPTVIEGSSTVAYNLATDGRIVVAVGAETTLGEDGVGAVWRSPPPPGVEPQLLANDPSQPGLDEAVVVVHPNRGVAVTGVSVTIDGVGSDVTVVLVNSEGERFERCTADISGGQGRCTFEVGDLPPGAYTAEVDGADAIEPPSFDVLPEASEVLVLGITYNATVWPHVSTIRVENHGADAVDVSGWSIEDDNETSFRFPDGTIADAGQSVGVIQHGLGGSTLSCPDDGPSFFHICRANDADAWTGQPLYLRDTNENLIDTWSR